MSTNLSNHHSRLLSENGTMHLEIEVCDSLVVSFLSLYEGPGRIAKVLEALRKGVGFLQTATPTLDMHLVKDVFTALEVRLGTA